MNLLNRVVVLLLLLALASSALAVVVLAWMIPDESIDWLRGATGWMDEHNQDFEKAVLTAAGLAVAFVALAVLVLELRPRSRQDVKVRDLRSGDAIISVGAIGLRLEETLRQVPHVSDAKAVVRSRRKGVEVSMDLHVDEDANLVEVTDAASEVARDVLANRMHVALARPPHARLHYRELRLRRPAGPASAMPSSPVAAEAPSALPPASGQPAGETPAPEKKDE